MYISMAERESARERLRCDFAFTAEYAEVGISRRGERLKPVQAYPKLHPLGMLQHCLSGIADHRSP
jgi:hypothetical protein